MEINPKWQKVSEEILTANTYQKLRWRKAPEAILAGEVRVLLNKNGLKATNETISSTSLIMKFVAQNSDLFYTNNENKIFSANLGKLIKNRVKNLENPEEKANTILKIWLTATLEDFVEMHLLKTLNYNKASNNSISLPLNDLLELVANWEYNKENKITAIAAEYYYTTKGNN